MVLPYDLEHFLGVIGGNRRFGLPALQGDFNELLLVFSVIIVGEPVVEVFPADAPSMSDSIRTKQSDGFNVLEENGFGGGKGEEIFVDDNEFLVDSDLIVVIEDLAHSFSNKFDSIIKMLIIIGYLSVC